MVSVTHKEVEAARLRIVCDLAREHETPPWVTKLATAKGSSPWEPPKVVPLRVRERRARWNARIDSAAWLALIGGLVLLVVAHGIIALAELGVIR